MGQRLLDALVDHQAVDEVFLDGETLTKPMAASLR
jgi:hypothetical protein